MAAELPSQNDTLERIERRLRTLLPPRWLMDAEPGHESVSDRCWTLHAPGGEAVSFAVKVGRKAPGRQLEADIGAARRRRRSTAGRGALSLPHRASSDRRPRCELRGRHGQPPFGR